MFVKSFTSCHASERINTNMNIKPRPLLVFWHRWFGLFSAIWLVAMAATGSILVFYSELDQALNTDLYFVTPQEKPLPAKDWIEAIESSRPDSFVSTLHLPDSPDMAAQVYLSPRPEMAETVANPSQIFVDPYTAAAIGERPLGELRFNRRHIMNIFYELHMDLLLGETMFYFLGFIALLWLIDHIVSLFISFTTLAKWRQSFRIRFMAGGYKRVFDLHRAIGLWLFPITLMFAVSSLYLTWYEPVVKVVNAVSPLTPRYIFTLPNQDSSQLDRSINLSSALAIARKASGDARPDIARLIARKNAYEIRFFDSRDIDPYGRRMLVVDASNGDVLSDRHITEGGAGNTFLAWQYPLHSGKGFGWAGRIIVFISGVMLILVIVTGVKIWLRKRRAVNKAKLPANTVNL